ncbi:unnamed protein product [Pleuronectes platessa]|uniref:Uncharacterized protein n=1 Tax=Pleuronectes platessa TaxID=8262 RepID=A0A9N7Y990_PLEPL|nr:unnamed protein product [Pleuronectes platessa]
MSWEPMGPQHEAPPTPSPDFCSDQGLSGGRSLAAARYTKTKSREPMRTICCLKERTELNLLETETD